MQNLIRLAFSLCLALVILHPASAAMLGDAGVAFRADRTVVVDGRRYSGRLFHTPGHQRHDQDLLGMHAVFLLDTGQAEGTLILPSLKAYVVFPFPPEMAELGAPDLLQAPVGQETVAGIPTTKYRVDHRSREGSRTRGFVWVSRAGIMMKLDIGVSKPHGGKPVAIAMELSHVEIGPQDPGLFVQPHGYNKLPPDALGALLGMKPR